MRPTGNVTFVKDRQTAAPEKKKGTAMMAEKSRKLTTVSNASDTSTGTASMVTRASGKDKPMAKTACTKRSWVRDFSKNCGCNCTASAPAVMPNIAAEMDTKAR